MKVSAEDTESDGDKSAEELSVSTQHVESDEGESAELSVSTQHRDHLSRKDFEVELVKRIAEANDLSEEHVCTRRNIQLDMSKLSVSPEDFQ